MGPVPSEGPTAMDPWEHLCAVWAWILGSKKVGLGLWRAVCPKTPSSAARTIYSSRVKLRETRRGRQRERGGLKWHLKHIPVLQGKRTESTHGLLWAIELAISCKGAQKVGRGLVRQSFTLPSAVSLRLLFHLPQSYRVEGHQFLSEAVDFKGCLLYSAVIIQCCCGFHIQYWC